MSVSIQKGEQIASKYYTDFHGTQLLSGTNCFCQTESVWQSTDSCR